MPETIRHMEMDIFSQIKCLSAFVPQKKLSGAMQNRAIFCGSGDSLAACMLAEAHSGMRARAADPLDLAKNPDIVSGMDLYAVSISGRTVSNIRAARLARSATAITSMPKSKLAKLCDKTIQLRFPNSDAVTAGTASFLDSALACISLVSDVKIRRASKLFDDAIRDAKAAKRRRGRVFFLGSLHTYPIAMYAAAKTYEITGSEAYYERLEQFSHMELFSTRRGDTAVIFEENSRHSNNLSSELESAGLHVERPSIPRNKTAQFLFCTFYSQIVPLLEAKRRGQNDCHFVASEKLRRTSDRMIY